MRNDSLYMARCLQLARLGEYYVAPNPMVGAVLVERRNESGELGKEVILGEGWHMQYGGPHAEPNCIRNAEKNHPEGIDYKHCTLYVSLEPCSHYGKTPPCAELIIKKGIGRVVVGCLDPNPKVAGRGVKMLQDAGIEVVVGVLEEECKELNKRFICLQEKKRPYVILKWAQTADGYIDCRLEVRGERLEVRGERLEVKGERLEVKGEGDGPLVISTPLMKQLVHQQRAENMAIMVGTRTVLLDNPKLLTTHWSGRNPIRITLDRHGVLPAESKIFSDESETIVYRENTDWTFILEDLAKRNIHSVLVEGGARLLNTIIESGVYDEVHVEVGDSLGLSVEGLEFRDLGVKAPEYTFRSKPKMIDGHCVYIERH
ncbi:MAG: bifunctional diaminohydroxyphosphoribosylaminopyrimidine deaminase/5-amino-6-(5-phosphoribosylamino)uracil reductase RibD [Paludibacteraceae bacterium]|nr:bifunctional diaminohydroxyphosphoribosylaminopyrimidine deaminase/5-amino-6-(5-phosphoribosylamino)uracil reductase RibD [Paludibacteraceae bacterium]